MTDIMRQNQQQTLSALQQFIEGRAPLPTSKEKVEKCAKLLTSAIDIQIEKGQEQLRKAKEILESCKKNLSQFNDTWSVEEKEYAWVEQCFNYYKGYIKSEFTYGKLDPSAPHYLHQYQALQQLAKDAHYFIKDSPANFHTHLIQQKKKYTEMKLSGETKEVTEAEKLQYAMYEHKSGNIAELLGRALGQEFATSYDHSPSPTPLPDELSPRNDEPLPPDFIFNICKNIL